jgi:hypothetical protein
MTRQMYPENTLMSRINQLLGICQWVVFISFPNINCYHDGRIAWFDT